ncbi:MAG: hypothetical protein LUF92_09315 [Clostridiales bacterium]|nr:hypothetical protein [Clostridiales bacterium]
MFPLVETMAEQNLDNNNQQQNSGQEDRTFSQEELDSIIKNRRSSRGSVD